MCHLAGFVLSAVRNNNAKNMQARTKQILPSHDESKNDKTQSVTHPSKGLFQVDFGFKM